MEGVTMTPEKMLLELLSRANPGPMKVGLHSEFAREVYAPPSGSEPVATFATETDAKAYAALANTGKALADCAQALRMMIDAYEMLLPGLAKISVNNYALINDAPCAARDALRALDATEVL